LSSCVGQGERVCRAIDRASYAIGVFDCWVVVMCPLSANNSQCYGRFSCLLSIVKIGRGGVADGIPHPPSPQIVIVILSSIVAAV
jgi:hypothetical protein